MIKKWIFAFVILTVVFVTAGCAYTLRYTISSSQSRQMQPPVRKHTFAVENKIRAGKKSFFTESDLLEIVKESLIEMEWEQVDKEYAEYIFSVEFETQRDRNGIEFGFGTSFGVGSGFFISSNFSTGRRDLYRQRLSIIAVSNLQEEYAWIAETTTSRVNQKITTLAEHIIPEALSHFPEEGYWEVKDKVRLYRNSKER